MPQYSQEVLIDLYRTMVRIRICEESLIEPIVQGTIPCPVHLSVGQEAIAAGVCAVLQKRDYVFSTHRSHGHYLAKGGDMRALIAELYGKKTGCSGGKGGSMHLVAPEKGFLGSVPVVGGTIALALGAALASQIRKEKRVCVSFFGDGATGEGVLYESLNFAALRKLPLIFVCENNLYSTHLSIKECRPERPIFEIARPFGIETRQIDGNNVLDVFDAAEEAQALCREGKGPVFLECLTYRLRGHVGPDDNIQGERTDIRPKEEIEQWKRKDPIKRLEQYFGEQGGYQAESAAIRKEAEQEVQAAHLFAKESPFPSPNELHYHVFS